MESKKTKEVSDLFIDIYKNFNVINQTDRMRQLSRKELLLMLILAIDTFNDDNIVVIDNYVDFKDELNIIFNSFPEDSDDNIDVLKDIDIIELGEETGDRFIDVTILVDSKGNSLPDALTDEEALIKRREIGIIAIINN